jgi:hypothetical protein
MPNVASVLSWVSLSAVALLAATPPAIAPRTTAIAWADCIYGLERLPTPPLTAYALTLDGIVIRTRSASTSEGERVESAVIGPKRFRAIVEGIDRSTLFDPPPAPTPGPVVGGLQIVGSTTPTDTRRARFAVRRDGEWTDWSAYKHYTQSEWAAVRAAYAAADDPTLVWHPAAPRANAFAVCQYDARRDSMTIPAPAPTSN